MSIFLLEYAYHQDINKNSAGRPHSRLGSEDSSMNKRKAFLIHLKSSHLKSPVPHLVGTNRTPTEEELDLILKAVATAKTYQEDLTNQLAATKEGVDSSFLSIREKWTSPKSEIARKLEETRKFIQNHMALTSSLRRIPPELLRIIFIHWSNDLPPTNNSTSIFDLPWKISQICRLWRDISLITPALWRRLPEIKLDKSFTRRAKFRECLTELLKRSEGSTIEVSISAVSFKRHHFVPYSGGHPCIGMLIKHSKRWSQLHVKYHDMLIFRELSPIKGCLSSLVELHIYNVGCSDHRIIANEPIDVFECAINLRELHKSGTRPVILSNAVKLRVFITYGIVRNSLEHTLGTAKAMSNSLTHLNLYFYCSARLPVRMAFPKLVNLVLYSHWSRGLGAAVWFLDCVTAPALERLEILDSGSLGEVDIACSVRDMIKRSRMTTLCSLKLDIRHRNAGILPEILLLAFSLRHLDTTLPPCEDLQRLAYCNNIYDMLVPFLKTCSFTTDKTSHHSPGVINALQRLGQNRCDRVMALNLVHPKDGEVECSRLDSLILHFPQISTATQYQCTLHGWKETDEVSQLVEARKILEGIFSEARRYNIRRSFFSSNPKMDRNTFTRATETLEIVQNIEANHASIILVFQILSIITHISHVYKPFKDYAIGVMATQILIKWRPLFKECRQKSLQWAVAHSCALEYVFDGYKPETTSRTFNLTRSFSILENEWYQSEDFWPFL